MKRLLFTLLCLGVLSTVTGCYIDPALPGVTSFEVGIGAYQAEVPYWDYHPRVYYRDDDWRYRRWERRRDRYYHYDSWR